MKIIKLFLLLSLGLWAECKQDIPNENEIDIKLLQNVVENGWRDKNKTLNQFIIRYKNRALPIVLKIIDKPLSKVEPTEDDVYPLPKIRLNRSDYWSLLAYVKYLEYIGESGKVLHIYTKIFEGLNYTEDKSILSMVFRIEIEKITVRSLNQALESHRFTQEQKNILKQRLSKVLLLDTQIFFDALEIDRIGLIKLMKSDKRLQNEFGREVIERVNFRLEEHNKEYSALKTESELKEFDKKFEEAKKRFLERYEKDKDKKQSHEIKVALESGLVTFTAARCISDVKISLWRNIEANKKLLENLN